MTIAASSSPQSDNMVISCGLHDHTSLTVQDFELTCQFAQFAVGVTDFKGRDDDLSKGTHDSNRASAFGNVDANRVHLHSSNTNLQPESIFSHCRFNLLGDANSMAQPAQIERCNKGMADSLDYGLLSPRVKSSTSCFPYCSLGKRWKEAQPDAGLPTKTYCNRAKSRNWFAAAWRKP